MRTMRRNVQQRAGAAGARSPPAFRGACSQVVSLLCWLGLGPLLFGFQLNLHSAASAQGLGALTRSPLHIRCRSLGD